MQMALCQAQCLFHHAKKFWIGNKTKVAYLSLYFITCFSKIMPPKGVTTLRGIAVLKTENFTVRSISFANQLLFTATLFRNSSVVNWIAASNFRVGAV
jgi:hypothetical protein